MKIDVIILAAGKGTRMRSSQPKALHPIGAKPMLQHVIDAATALGDVHINVVVGHGAEKIKEVLGNGVNYILQEQQLGTGHAVLEALPALREGATCLILYGDVPLIKTKTLQRLVAAIDSQSMAMLTASLEDPAGYGRIIRNNSQKVQAIVEQKDATPSQLEVIEINTGIMCILQQQLIKWLPELSNENAQNEYYLTDVISMAVADGIEIKTTQPKTLAEIEGVNNKVQLASLERIYQAQLAEQLMIDGATLADPTRVDIRGQVRVGSDVFIDINAVFIGNVVLGNNVSIGANCVIQDTKIGDNTQILANSVIEQSEIANDCSVGPFGRMRPGARLEQAARTGNFVEVKNSTISKGSKVNHLAYIGDAEVGEFSNIGAGTIICNYDGANKFKTKLGANVFIGSNSTLVAPLEIADNGFVAAGSTVTQTVSDGDLAVGRAKQRNIKGWKRPVKPAK